MIYLSLGLENGKNRELESISAGEDRVQGENPGWGNALISRAIPDIPEIPACQVIELQLDNAGGC